MPASKAQQAITADRRTRALNLRVAGATFEQIAEQLGYSGRGAACTDILRALETRRKELDEAAGQAVTLELERLDTLERSAWGVLRRKHILVSQGRVIRDENGQPMTDDGPILDAMDRLLKIQARRARLLGLDAPVKTEVRTVDNLDDEIRRLMDQLARPGQTGTAAPAASADAEHAG